MLANKYQSEFTRNNRKGDQQEIIRNTFPANNADFSANDANNTIGCFYAVFGCFICANLHLNLRPLRERLFGCYNLSVFDDMK